MTKRLILFLEDEKGFWDVASGIDFSIGTDVDAVLLHSIKNTIYGFLRNYDKRHNTDHSKVRVILTEDKL